MIDTSFIPSVLDLTKDQVIEAVLRGPCELPELVAFMTPPGRSPLYLYTVLVAPGKEVTCHCHDEDTVLYYVNPVVPVILDDKPYQPVPGETVLIPAKVMHSVPLNTTNSRRISVALKLVTSSSRGSPATP